MDLNGIDWNVFSHGNHVGGIAAGSKNGKVMHGVAFDAIKRMYFKLMSEYEGEPESASSRGSYRAVTTQQQMAQILTFINLPAPQAGPALSAVVNNAAAQSMALVQRNSMTGDILSSHFGDRFREERKADALLPLQSLRDSSHINGGASGKKVDAAPLCGEAGEQSETEVHPKFWTEIWRCFFVKIYF